MPNHDDIQPLQHWINNHTGRIVRVYRVTATDIWVTPWRAQIGTKSRDAAFPVERGAFTRFYTIKKHWY